ncbi:MAG: LysM peptidoglycan-binding domain-containing protein [Proteobacteria bacterium]|nr:LysM peptidoglycan-binding domain-containing protein [Pseudomonadota bacterium]
MIKSKACLLTGRVFLTIIFLLVLLNVDYPRAATLYKRYIVANTNGQEILCEPYIVAPNDYVIKLFKQKGEISHQDFPEFLNLFQQINPNIINVNKIHTGQQILIPLKKIAPNSFPDQETGIVDIPFITITSIPDILKRHAQSHNVKRNDVISRLISKHYGPYGSKSYKEGIEIFKTLNPHISDLNKIYIGQKLILPDASLRNELYYTALFDSSGRLKQDGAIDMDEYKEEKAEDVSPDIEKDETPYKLAATALSATIKDNGIYFFPTQSGKDIQIDLSKFPLIEKPDGEKILFVSSDLTAEQKSALNNAWPNLTLTPASENESLEHILNSLVTPGKNEKLKNAISFADLAAAVSIKTKWIFETENKDKNETYKNCVFIIGDSSEKTPELLCQYLKEKQIVIKDIVQSIGGQAKYPKYFQKGIISGNYTSISSLDKKSFINDLVIALDFYYAPNISISFPYSGIQIKAFASLISTGDGQELLVDFENIYGDAFDAIKSSGFSIISIKKMETPDIIIEKILKSLNISYQVSQVFKGAERTVDENIFIQIEGSYYIEHNKSRKYLLLLNPIPEKIMQFIQNLGIDIISIQA